MPITDPAVAAYAESHTTPPAPALAAVVEQTRRDSLSPTMMSTPVVAQLLAALIVATDAVCALEIGTFTGYGALTLATAMNPNGQVTTIENNGDSAALARENFAASPVGDRIELMVGDAREALRGLTGPFDVVFIDAWKRDYIAYYDACVPMLSPRGVIVADNVLWSGDVVAPVLSDEAAEIAAFNEHVQADRRTRNVLLSVGDGLMLAWRAGG